MSGLSVLCNAVCEAPDEKGAMVAAGSIFADEARVEEAEASEVPRPSNRPRQSPVTYASDANLPLLEPPVREGEILHLCPEDGRSFRKVRLSLFVNGLSITPLEGERMHAISIAWSPFSLVQACRLHSIQADENHSWMRLFKVSIFHHGLTHFFACTGDQADLERARWVADVSRVLRVLTQSLYPEYSIRTEPLAGASWTATRLLAGYLLLYDDLGVSLVYGELHAHCDTMAAFAAYEDDCCDVQIVHLSIDMHTCVSERVGIDCSCFSLGDHHFSTRSCTEKMLWLRAISNVKVKLRHWASNPSETDLKHYRSSIREHARNLPQSVEAKGFPRGPLLPRRNGPPLSTRGEPDGRGGTRSSDGVSCTGGPAGAGGTSSSTNSDHGSSKVCGNATAMM